MASTFFQDYNQNNPIVSSWLNDVNNAVYGANGTARLAISAAAVLVSFSVVGGIVTVGQSVNVLSVVRNSLGSYTINYASPMAGPGNIYQISLGQAGIGFWTAQTSGSVTLSFQSLSGVSIDPTSAGVLVFGVN